MLWVGVVVVVCYILFHDVYLVEVTRLYFASSFYYIILYIFTVNFEYQVDFFEIELLYDSLVSFSRSLLCLVYYTINFYL